MRPDLFDTHELTEEQQERMAAVRNAALTLAREIEKRCPPSADATAAIRLLRQAVWTANSAIALHGQL